MRGTRSAHGRVACCLAAAVVVGLVATSAQASPRFRQAPRLARTSVPTHRVGSNWTTSATSLSRAVSRAAVARGGTAPFAPQTGAAMLGDGVTLLAPPNGGAVPAGTTVTFSWTQGWFCTDCEIGIAIVVATDAQFQNPVIGAEAECPQSSAPSCPTSVTLPGFTAGTYYWAVGVVLGDAVHVSDIWSFTAAAAAPTPPAPATPTAPGRAGFADGSGDGKGAPDIVDVGVSNDANGQIAFDVAVPGSAELAPDEGFALLIDADENPGTGAPNSEGSEVLIVLDGESKTWGLLKWNGTSFAGAPAPTAMVQYGNGPLISVNRSDLGVNAGLNFWVYSVKGEGDAALFDDAPDRGTWNYKLGTTTNAPGPLTPPATPKKATVTSIKVLALPAAPTAGLQFRILVPSVHLSTGQDVRPTTARCTARLAGKALAGRGAGRCTFTISRGSGGSSLSVTITVTYRGATKSRTVTFRVRRP